MNNSQSGTSGKVPPGVETAGRTGKSNGSGGDNVPKDKSIVVDANNAGIAVAGVQSKPSQQELATGVDGKSVPSSVLGAGANGSNTNGFGDNTIPMGMAFQSFGGTTQSPPNLSQMNMLGQQG